MVSYHRPAENILENLTQTSSNCDKICLMKFVNSGPVERFMLVNPPPCHVIEYIIIPS